MTTPESTLKILQYAEKAHKSLVEQADYSLGKGPIKAERFAASGRKASYRYIILTLSGLSEKLRRLLEKFVERKREEYEELSAEPERMK